MSSGLSVNETLRGYLAGDVTAAQLSAVIAGAYYRETGNGRRETFRPIMDVIERAHPGVVELKAAEQSPGFEVRLAERPFPKRFDAALRQAVELALATFPDHTVERPSFFRRIVAAIRRVFSS